MIMNMSQQKPQKSPKNGVKSCHPTELEYYEDDEQHIEVLEMRPSMDEEEAGKASPMPELQTAQVGHSSLEWDESRAAKESGTIYVIEIGRQKSRIEKLVIAIGRLISNGQRKP
jgi:hypothetical protein